MYRKFIYANGSKMALSLSKEAVRGIVVALCVAGSFKYFVDESERTNIVKYYKVPQIPSKYETVSDSL